MVQLTLGGTFSSQAVNPEGQLYVAVLTGHSAPMAYTLMSLRVSLSKPLKFRLPRHPNVQRLDAAYSQSEGLGGQLMVCMHPKACTQMAREAPKGLGPTLSSGGV